MKIGILTLPLHVNYGGILQAYALQTVLEKMGHEVQVLNLPQKKRIPCNPFLYFKRIIKKILFRSKVPILYEREYNHEIVSIASQTYPFIEKHIKQRIINSLDEIRENDYEAIVVGSDQIWRMYYFCGLWNIKEGDKAFLSFTRGWNIKRISYAASFGIDKFESKFVSLDKCKEAIDLFNTVSVRELSGVKICKEDFGVVAKVVLDPTMLLDESDYNAIIVNTEQKKYKYIFSYILDMNTDKNDTLNKFSEYLKLPVVYGNVQVNDSSLPLVERIQPSVESWLLGIKNADVVITDSFHATVFSILFKKKFFVINNEERGASRIVGILNTFNLESRFLKSVDKSVLSEIDYSKVDVILNNQRIDSLDFLKSGLS